MFKNFKKRTKKNSLVNFFLSLPKEQGLTGIEIGILLAIIAVSTALAVGAAPVAMQKIMGDIGWQIIIGIASIFFIACKALFQLGASLLKGVLGFGFMQIALTKTEIVQVGFALVRDIANMGIVLGFVVVGIATILRIREYDAQKALFPLIVLAIFINFSLVFCGVIIDASNILVDYFLNKGGAKNIVFPFEDMVKNSGSAQKMDEYAAAGDQAGFAQAAFLFGLLLLITAYAFILLSIILVVRQAMLMVLLILSPLGFFCAVFKATKPAFSKWWNEFLKWSFIGVGIVFFIYLAAYLVAVGIPGVSKQTNQDQQEQLGSLAFLVPIIF